MNTGAIILIALFLGCAAAISGTVSTYIKRKKYLDESKVKITNIENDLLEIIRDIGLDRLQGTQAGRELCLLLNKKELLFIAGDAVNLPVSEVEGYKDINPYAPYLYIAVGLIGACSGIASILVPWLLLQTSPEWQCLLYPLLIAGLVGGVTLAYIMDTTFQMEKATPYLRFLLSAVSGLFGGWIGLLAIIMWIAYKMIPAKMTSYGGSQNKQNP